MDVVKYLIIDKERIRPTGYVYVPSEFLVHYPAVPVAPITAPPVPVVVPAVPPAEAVVPPAEEVAPPPEEVPPKIEWKTLLPMLLVGYLVLKKPAKKKVVR